MGEKYSDELLNMKFGLNVLNGTKGERIFFSITEEFLRDRCKVLPTDSLEEARQKITSVIYSNEFLYEYFQKDPRTWEFKIDTGFWMVPAKEEKILSREDILEKGYEEEDLKKMRFPVKETSVAQAYESKFTISFSKRKIEKIGDLMSDEFFFKLYEKEFKEFLAHDNVFGMILKNAYAAQTPKRNSKQKYDSEKLLVIPDVELHMGKLASKFDSTDSYDYKKALYRYVKIILEAEKVQQTYHAKEICMTIGNDFFNTDTEQNTTTAGTEQHNDTRFQQMISTGIVAHIWAIERMRKNCDKLIIKFNPGNHDFLTDYFLYMQLCDKYRNEKDVEIRSEVKDLRWTTGLVWHNNLIIFCHGKGPDGKALNDDKLSELKDTMYRTESKGVDFITVLAGHLHNATENNYSKKKKASNGVAVVRNGSPSGDGAWDAQNLYSSDKSHQVYIFDANRGLYSTVNLQLTRAELEKGVSLPSITDNTDYLRAVECGIASQTESVLADDVRRLYNENEKQIRQIEKKYEKLLKKINGVLSDPEFTDEQKKNLLSVVGYEEEMKPYLEKRATLSYELRKGNL